MQDHKAQADAAEAELRQELLAMAGDVANNGLQCTELQTRVTKLREELLVLVSAEAEKREDSVATMRAAMESGLAQGRQELAKLEEALQVRLENLHRTQIHILHAE